METLCLYRGKSGGRCQESKSTDSDYCYWHDSSVDKFGDDIKEKLEQRAASGVLMEGFQLKKTNLDGINLINPDGQPYRLINSNLCRASLQGAHLYRVDLSGSSLLKADLSKANLRRSNLENCDLLGVNLKNAGIEHTHFGNKILQEKKGKAFCQQGKHKEALECFEEAGEVARNLRRHCETQGMFTRAGHFFYKEMRLHRFRLPRYSFARLLSWLVDLVSGYGEKPARVIVFSASFILFCSLFYFLFGIQDSGQLVIYQPGFSLSENLRGWLDSLYFSVVTFTTLGYGDLTPVGPSRFFAALEAFIGSFTLALFVVVFVKKMTR
ncbi:potassium transporter Kef [Endozoicomonas sp. OPT23]|uniref:ion channel n=1 Tax=Endozoicomonas sp. OPT23 TaxID=2072845 RepID=UPI00129AA1EF|nr:ion channel [Endozoicomonas sp. OPT23]MRI32038.1 potassium transporter Kef [Endozoicomonas sp. OPT23]